MADSATSNLIGLLSVIAEYTRATSFDIIRERAYLKKHLLATSQMLSRLCRLGYVRLEISVEKQNRYRITDDGRSIIKLPVFERHTLFLQRKEVHPEGHKCCICGYSGPGLTRFQRKDYCTSHLNIDYEPAFIYRECSALSWER